jgi:hypothetical protein
LGGEKMKNMVIISLDEYNELKEDSDDYMRFYKALSLGSSTVTADGEKILKLINDRYHNGSEVFKEFKTR